MPSEMLSRQARRKLKRLARGLLRGVGTTEERVEMGEVALHLRRPLTSEEIAGLPKAWLDSPAVDVA